MKQLQLSLIGSFQVTLDGEAIANFRFDRVRALLAYLAIKRHEPLERSALALLLWPDESAKRGLENLRQALATLRRALRDKQQTVPFLLTTSQTIQLNPAAHIEVDLGRFNELIARVKQHPHRHVVSCAHCIALLSEATTLIRGEFLQALLIDSDLFEEWAREIREQFHRQAANTLALVCEARLRHEKYEAALQLAQRQLRLDPLSTHGNHQLLQALSGLGQRNEAIRHFIQYRRLLNEELMLKPPQRTVALFHKLAADDWQLQLQLERPPAGLPQELAPFIGYATELAALRERLALATSRLITVTGPAGCGKSRLALRCGWLERPHFADGVFFIPLQNIPTSAVWEAVANGLNLSHNGTNAQRQLWQFSRERELLLILDGCDAHLALEPELQRWLRHAPGLNLLLTSRTRCATPAEVVVELNGLSRFNAATDTIDHSAALELLTTHAQLPLSERDGQLVELCTQLGGLPGALEVAGHWLQSHGVAAVATELQQLSSFKQLPHDCMLSTYQRDWQRLSRGEQAALHALAAHDGCFTSAAAQQLGHTDGQTLTQLHAKSWLMVARVGALVRLRLNPFVRWFVLQQVDAATAQAVQQEHAAFYMAWAEQHLEQLAGDAGTAATLFQQGQQEGSNVRQAWHFARRAGADSQLKRRAERTMRRWQRLTHWYEENAERCRQEPAAWGEVAYLLQRR